MSGVSVQSRLIYNKTSCLKRPYSYGPYNVIRGQKQAIRLTEGCVWDCPNCHEPTNIKIFDIPKIERNEVLIFDMNLLCKPEALSILQSLPKRLNNKRVRYEFVCGIDYRFLTFELAVTIHNYNFGCYVGFDSKFHKNRLVRLAWDYCFNDQRKIKHAIGLLLDAGFKSTEIMVFMQCNYSRCSYEENLRKLDLCKVWGVKVCDCYFDGQIGSNIKPVFWSKEQITSFRVKCRKHNQLVNFGIDPEIKEAFV